MLDMVAKLIIVAIIVVITIWDVAVVLMGDPTPPLVPSY